MLRTLRRSVAKTYMKNSGFKTFGRYVKADVQKWDKKTGKFKTVSGRKSLFAKNWRKFL